MRILQEPVLMLNKSWVAVDTTTVGSAFSRIFAETARFLSTVDYSLHDLDSWLGMPVGKDDLAIRTAYLSIRVPEVIVLKSGITPKRRTMQFGRRNLMRRDRHACQYCGARSSARDLTVDHVLPRKRGGKSSWLNCVASCLRCNASKADKTLQEAGMILMPRPELKVTHPHDPGRWNYLYEPAWSPVFKSDTFKESWKQFLTNA